MEQIIDLRNTLRYLGVPMEGCSYMFGDNETIVNMASMPHGCLHKRQNVLAFHKTQWGIATRVAWFHHVRGDTNPADILSKHWDYALVWSQLKPLLFWQGDTAVLSKSTGGEEEAHKETSAMTPKS